jgi:hypothetical protein
MRKSRPKLWRLRRTIEEAKVMPIWEAARIMTFPCQSKALDKAVSELETLGLVRRSRFDRGGQTYELLVSANLKATGQDLDRLLNDYCEKLRYEDNFIGIAEWWLERNKLGKEFRKSESRQGPFDAVGKGISQRFAFVLFCVNLRRVVGYHEMESFIERLVPEWRKKYYLRNNELTEETAGHSFTDVDIEATKDGLELEIVLCECRNWNPCLAGKSFLSPSEN